jgi:hypothetical protein
MPINPTEYSQKLIKFIKDLNIKVDANEDTLSIDGIEIIKDLVPVQTISGIKLFDGYIASVRTLEPSCNRDEPDTEEEVTIYEGRSMEAAIQAAVLATLKNSIQMFIENSSIQELELEEFELEKSEGI